jgi:molecular chaperone GrpE
MATKKKTVADFAEDVAEQPAETDAQTQTEDGNATLDALAEALEAGTEDDLLETPLSGGAAELIAVTAERDELKDKLLRALADSENTRRRAERDRKDAERYGGAKLARDLLSVLDNFDRAMEAANDAVREAAPDFVEGIELTKRELLSAFAKHKIEKIEPELGERFDPNRHQAMFEAPAPGAAAGTVIQLIQPGFVISDRLLRAAMVGVAKADPNAAAPPEKADADADDAAEEAGEADAADAKPE